MTEFRRTSRRHFEGKKNPAGNYAYIEADKVGWWITFVTVYPSGVMVKTGTGEAYRKYDSINSLKAGLKKAPYHISHFKRGKPPQGI